MDNKICTKCKRLLPNTIEYFHFDKNKHKRGYLTVLASACKECKNKQKSIYAKEKRKKQILEYGSSYKAEKILYPDSINQKLVHKRERYKNDIEFRKACRRRSRKNHEKIRDNLSDLYVAMILTRAKQNLKPKEIRVHKEILDIKRIQLQIYRTCQK